MHRLMANRLSPFVLFAAIGAIHVWAPVDARGWVTLGIVLVACVLYNWPTSTDGGSDA